MPGQDKCDKSQVFCDATSQNAFNRVTRLLLRMQTHAVNLALNDGVDPGCAQIWQIDTGVVAVPDLSQRYPSFIESLSLGFIATNNRGEQANAADFVIEQVGAFHACTYVHSCLKL